MKNIIIAELAGKDSIAAIIKYAKENPGSTILPIIVKSPTEEDIEREMNRYCVKLHFYLMSYGVNVIAPLSIKAEKEWYNLNRYISDSIKNYGFYTPCIACHGLVHAVRIPYAKEYSGKIITGERLSHNGKIKVNQNQIVLNIYNQLFEQHNIEIIRPLENIRDTKEIDEIMKDFVEEYKLQDFKFAECYMSGNCNVVTEDDLKNYKIKEYCNEYLIPKLNEIIFSMN